MAELGLSESSPDEPPTPPSPAQERQYRDLMRYWGEPEGESPAEKKAETIRQWKEGKAKKKAAGKSAKPAGKVSKGKTDAT